MPQYDDETEPLYDDDDDEVDEPCNHCECWEEGGSCCDCGQLSTADMLIEPEEGSVETAPPPVYQTDDDGSEELSD